MNKFLLSAVTAFALTTAAASAAPEPTPSDTWQTLESETLSEAWQTIFAAVREPIQVQADFTETRFFSFRKKPVEVSGTLSFTRDVGLILHYRNPKEEILQIDEDGLQITRDRKKIKTRNFARKENVAELLLTLFRFQLSELEKSFQVRGHLTDENWRIKLLPIDSKAKPVEEVQFSGFNGNLSKIELILPRSRRIEIELSNLQRFDTIQKKNPRPASP